ncbi:MAG: NmrA family NAD(P)-binding protein [Polyangiales bacterium]
MHIILGGTGHIGSALSELLLSNGEPVTVVTRSDDKRRFWENKGARVAAVDVRDHQALRQLFTKGKRVYLLNPPADPSTDIDAVERQGVRALLSALEGSRLQKVVAASTYGAQPGAAIGDLGVLYELEQGLIRQPIPAAIVRGAYYMSNWDMALDTARESGEVHSLLPADFELPMVAPADIAHVAARLLTAPIEVTGIHAVEGPEHYSPNDVAAAFAAELGKPVKVVAIPRDQWVSALQNMGFSATSAQSMAAMTRITVDNPAEVPEAPVRGTTTLRQYVHELVSAAS